VRDKAGLFEVAGGGTIFLDEIGEVAPTVQAKLLRALQEREIRRVGGERNIKINARVVAATNRDLRAAVEAGTFREDLFFRLGAFIIDVPPLRDRRDDIPPLVHSFLTRAASRMKKDVRAVSADAMSALMNYRWPGNVRELENCLERAAIMSESGTIDREAVTAAGIQERVDTPVSEVVHNVDLNDPDVDERERVIAALEQAGWVQAKAARLLNMTPRQIAYRIQTLNIKVRVI
jgi:Nif-specific regulatory protein